jgi:hypothetical protein
MDQEETMRLSTWLRGVLPALLFAMPFAAAAQGELVLYCTVQEEWCRPMVAAFEKTTGIKVLMTRKSSGEFYAQIKAEAANPRGDIVSVVAGSKVYDKPLDAMELLSYYFLLVVAGNETTRNAMTGGLLAFMENPGEWERLRRIPRCSTRPSRRSCAGRRRCPRLLRAASPPLSCVEWRARPDPNRHPPRRWRPARLPPIRSTSAIELQARRELQRKTAVSELHRHRNR